MPGYSRDRDDDAHREERAKRRGLDYLLDRGDDVRRARSRPSSDPYGRGAGAPARLPAGASTVDRGARPGQASGLRVSAPESFDVPCQTEVRAATGDTRNCGAPAREYRVYMNNTWQRWVICSAHAAYYRSWGAELSVLVDS